MPCILVCGHREVKAEDDLASDKKSSDTMIVVCSEENEGKQDPLDDTDAKKKKRTRRRKRKLPTRNDTSQNPIQDDPVLSDQEGLFINEMVGQGRKDGKTVNSF